MTEPPTPLPVRSKLPASGTSIFSVMSALAQQHGAVNLGQGFPDYAIDPALIDLVTAAMRAGHNQYPLSSGVMALREAIAGKVLRLYGRSYDPEHEVTVTSGATQAIFTTIGALAHPGDEVIVFEPAYDSYIPAVRLAGAIPVPLPLAVPGYRIDWAAVRRALTPRTRMILVNTPNNPGTSVLSADDCAQLAALTRGTGIVVVSDEVYEHMVYDGARHESLARHDELARRSVVIGSFGKTFHATGWKVGYALAPRAISAEIRRVHQFTVFTVHSPTQHALADFLREPERYEALPQFFARKRDLLRAALAPRRSSCCPAQAAISSWRATIASATSRRRRSPSGWCANTAWRPFRCRRSTRTARITASFASVSRSATRRCWRRPSGCGVCRVERRSPG